jgi:hypothetical protein
MLLFAFNVKNDLHVLVCFMLEGLSLTTWLLVIASELKPSLRIHQCGLGKGQIRWSLQAASCHVKAITLAPAANALMHETQRAHSC